MFRRQRWARVPRVIRVDAAAEPPNNEPIDREPDMPPYQMLIREHLVAEGVLAIMNREPVNEVRQMPRGMVFRPEELLRDLPPAPPRPLFRENDPRAPPRAMLEVLQTLNDGHHRQAYKLLRARLLSEAAEQGINHSI